MARNAAEHTEEKRSPSREDFDRISRVTNDSPIVNNQGSMGRKTIESLKEIERNRQLHLAKQGARTPFRSVSLSDRCTGRNLNERRRIGNVRAGERE